MQNPVTKEYDHSLHIPLIIAEALIDNDTMNQVSFCQFEMIADVNDIDVLASDNPLSPKGTPPLTIMSLSLRTVMHLATEKSEVVCASIRVWKDCTFSLSSSPPSFRS